MTSPDSPSPRTEAGRRFHANEHGAVCSFAAKGSCALVNDGPWGKAWIAQIEAEAAQEAPAPDGLPRGVLLREIDDARNAGIRPAGGDELRAWNYLLDHFEQFIKGWPFPSPAEPPRHEFPHMAECRLLAGRGSHSFCVCGCHRVLVPTTGTGWRRRPPTTHPCGPRLAHPKDSMNPA